MLPSRRLRRPAKPRPRYVLEFDQPISADLAQQVRDHFDAWIKSRKANPLLVSGATVKEFHP